MNFLNLFNKRRVSLSDTQDMQTFANNTSALRSGPLMSKGLVKENVDAVMGKVDSINYKPANWIGAISGGAGPSYNTFNISAPSTTPITSALMAYNSVGDLIIIPPGATTYTASPTMFQSSGNSAIPFKASPTIGNYYYVYIGSRDVRDSTYNRVDKNGVVKYPKQKNGYEIYVVESATIVTAASIMPAHDCLYVGRIHYTGLAMVPADVDQTECIFAGVYQQNTKIKIDTSTPPATYANGETKSLDEHINAIDDASAVSVINPHGTVSSTFGAVSQQDVSIDKQIMRNGIVSCSNIGATGADYYSNTTEFQAKINNVIGNTYVYINAPTYSKFMWNGRLYEVSDLLGWNGSKVIVTFTGDGNGGGDAQGWYQIYINEVGGVLQLVKTTSGQVDMNQSEDSPLIILGFVYLKNSGGSFILRRNENTNTLTPDNDPIIPYYTWATLNPKHISKINSEYAMHSENLITPMAGGTFSFAYNCPTPNINWNIVTGTATTLTVVPSNYYIGFTATNASSNFKAKVTTFTKPRSSEANISLLPNKKTLYTFSFAYVCSAPNTYDNVYMEIGGIKYYIPIASATISRRYCVVLNSYPTQIDFYLENVVAKTSTNWYVSNIKLVEGVVMSDIYLTDTVYTSSVILDSNVSRYRDGGGVMQTYDKRTLIQNSSLDNIIMKIPVAQDLPLMVNGALGSDNPDFAVDVNNLEMWFVRGRMTKIDAWTVWQNVYHYEAIINYSSANYKPVYVNFFKTTPVMAMSVAVNIQTSTAQRVYEEMYVYDTTPTSMTLRLNYRAGTGPPTANNIYEDFNQSFYFNGMMIMQRI